MVGRRTRRGDSSALAGDVVELMGGAGNLGVLLVEPLLNLRRYRRWCWGGSGAVLFKAVAESDCLNPGVEDVLTTDVSAVRSQSNPAENSRDTLLRRRIGPYGVQDVHDVVDLGLGEH